MPILITCPGRHGDILWALPAIRALHEALEATIHLAVAPPYAGLCDLIGAQPYIDICLVLDDWVIVESAPITPRVPPTIPSGYDAVYHLGYDGWPSRPLPDQHLWELQRQLPSVALAEQVAERYDLRRPWISCPKFRRESWMKAKIGVLFTDEWIELKVGILAALTLRFDPSAIHFLECGPPRPSRWEEFREHYSPVGFAQLPVRLIDCDLVLADCSAGHVLACGLGVPVVLVEPNEARHHPIFYPYGTGGPQVTLVKGTDGRPTFDARHVGDAIHTKLQEITNAR